MMFFALPSRFTKPPALMKMMKMRNSTDQSGHHYQQMPHACSVSWETLLVGYLGIF
jgi:hypothetical protein